MSTVTALHVAPVKALAAVPRPQVRLEHDGVPEDRRLFLLRADGSVATIRQIPTLALVEPDLDLAAGTLAISLPDGTAARSDLAATGAPLQARLFGKDRAGHHLPGDVEEALSAYAEEPLRLALADRTGTGWDEGPVSIVTRASAVAVDAPSGEEQMRRFRMLVEFEGAAAYEEDSWVGHDVRIGGAVVRVTHPLERCVVITTSPRTAEKDWDGLRTLVERRGRDLICLGVIATVVTPGDVRVGDPIEVLMT